MTKFVHRSKTSLQLGTDDSALAGGNGSGREKTKETAAKTAAATIRGMDCLCNLASEILDVCLMTRHSSSLLRSAHFTTMVLMVVCISTEFTTKTKERHNQSDSSSRAQCIAHDPPSSDGLCLSSCQDN